MIKGLLTEQLSEILKIQNEEVNPFGRPFKDLSESERNQVTEALDAVPELKINQATHASRIRKAKAKKDKGEHTVIMLGKFNPKTADLINERAKELGLKYPADLINHAIEEFLGLRRGQSTSKNRDLKN